MQGRSAQRRRPRCAGRARRKRALGRTNLTKPVQPQVIDLCASDCEQKDPDTEPIVVADDGPSPGPFPRLAPPNHEVVVIADDYPSPLQAVAARTVQLKRLPSFAALSKSLPQLELVRKSLNLESRARDQRQLELGLKSLERKPFELKSSLVDMLKSLGPDQRGPKKRKEPSEDQRASKKAKKPDCSSKDNARPFANLNFEELDKLVEGWDFEAATRLFETVLSPAACQAALKECVSANDFDRLVEIWQRMWSFLTPGAMFAAPVLGPNFEEGDSFTAVCGCVRVCARARAYVHVRTRPFACTHVRMSAVLACTLACPIAGTRVRCC